MNYSDPELIESVAGEYVLGTLRGAARHRFQRLSRERQDVREAIWRWERRLAALALVADPVNPPQVCWQRIESRIWPKTQGAWSSVNLWRSWSAFATAASVVLALWLIPLLDKPAPPPKVAVVTQPPGPDHVSIIGDSVDPQWVVSANLETGSITLRAINAGAAAVEQVFELWMLPTSGNPQSIGLLPVAGQSVTLTLPPSLLVLLRESKGLAVSVEPPGGSPTGLPTGPVVHTANILEL